jgi:hypothetical protein
MSLRSIRNAALNFISQMIENYDDKSIEAVLIVAEKYIT